jgi:membrane-bound lytic murein transglycosylase A
MASAWNLFTPPASIGIDFGYRIWDFGKDFAVESDQVLSSQGSIPSPSLPRPLYQGAVIMRSLFFGVLASGLCLVLHQSQPIAQAQNSPKLAPPTISSPTPSPPSPSPTPSATPSGPVLRALEKFPADLGLDDRLYAKPGDRAALVSALDQSLKYIQSPQAEKIYKTYPINGLTRDRVERSLSRFRQLVLASRTAEQLRTSVQKEFQAYESIGKDGQGLVHFTGYFEPSYRASRKPNAEYRYPLYKLPADFANWKTPHPTREALEGKDGLQAAKGKLKGLELVYMNDRLQAFLIQVQGSARLQLTDGTMMSIGYAGATNHPYSGVGRELVKAGKFKLEELTLPKVVNYFKQNPKELDLYLPKNLRFVFFRDTQGAAPMGSLNTPVTAERSIATDKKIMPPGALALLQTQLPDNALQQQSINRFVLDQDTGSAIIGPGRVDLFMGTGDRAGAKAGLVNAPGKLYYLLLKNR